MRRAGAGRLLAVLPAVLLATAATAQRSDRPITREHRLPCDGVVSLYYDDELIWRKGPGELRDIDALVEVPNEKKPGMAGLQLASLLALRPDVGAIELESCQPRLRRFERADLESEHGAGLYLVATNYRGFRLRNVTRQRGGGGGGMKNIGKIVLVPARVGAAAGAPPDSEAPAHSGDRRGRGDGSGAGRGAGGQKSGEKTEKTGEESGEKSGKNPPKADRRP